MTQKKTGRPSKYGPDDIASAVAKAEAQFEAPRPAQVKQILCKDLGISSAINDASFQTALSQYYEDREMARRKSVIAGLPDAVRNKAVVEVRGTLEDTILLLLGESYAAVRDDAERRVAEAENMTRDVTYKLRAIEANLDEKDRDIAKLKAERDAARARIAELDGEIVDLKRREAARESEAGVETRMFDALGRILGEITATPEQTTKLTEVLNSLGSPANDAARTSEGNRAAGPS